mgnify:CR=1 FL=1
MAVGVTLTLEAMETAYRPFVNAAGMGTEQMSETRRLYEDFLQLTPDRVIWPGLAISLTVLSVNYMGDGLRDALDPRQR